MVQVCKTKVRRHAGSFYAINIFRDSIIANSCGSHVFLEVFTELTMKELRVCASLYNDQELLRSSLNCQMTEKYSLKRGERFETGRHYHHFRHDPILKIFRKGFCFWTRRRAVALSSFRLHA